MAPPDPWLDLTAAAWGEIPGRPLRFYLHVPYCTHRCDYCDFTTYTPDDPRGRGQAQWLPGVRTELALAARVLPAALAGPVHSIFIGGGTPTLLAPETLGVAIADIADRWGLMADCEITVEANPETITPSLAAGLLAAGVTRVSVGMQSAVPAVLGALGRRHRPSTMVTAIECLRRAGLQRLSVDLIYGADGESLAQWQVSVQAALDLGVGHISAYGLIVEPGTALAARVARGVTRPPDDEDLAIKYELADAAFEAAGLRWYEIANWARPGEQCAHNSGYWRADTWWGVGPGAHSIWGECAGGTEPTRMPGRSGWPMSAAIGGRRAGRLRGGSCSAPSNGRWSRQCAQFGCVVPGRCRGTGACALRSWRRDWSSRLASTMHPSPAGAGCWPTMWCTEPWMLPASAG